MLYRITAIPVAAAKTTDVMVVDERGRHYLLEFDGLQLTPLTRGEVNLLGAFFEPALDVTWRSQDELRAVQVREPSWLGVARQDLVLAGYAEPVGFPEAVVTS